MSLSSLLLALFVLISATFMRGWHSSSLAVVVVGLAYVIVWLLELSGVLTYNIPIHRK